jgi:hypothetical protein
MGKQTRLKQERRERRFRDQEGSRLAQEARREAAERDVEEGRRRGCLFCRRRDREFSSVEHVFPETLGNKDKVLPVGVVCDRCNHEVLSCLDAALCDFAPVAMLRTIYGIESKSGKRPSFKFDNGSLHSDKPRNLKLSLDSKRWYREGLPAPPGRKAWSFTGKRHDATPKRLSLVHRALTKIALECAFLDLGEERILSSEFDHERSVVLDGGHHGYLILAKEGKPDSIISMTYVLGQRAADEHPFMGFVAGFWGFPIISDTLNAAPLGDVPAEEASVIAF